MTKINKKYAKAHVSIAAFVASIVIFRTAKFILNVLVLDSIQLGINILIVGL